MAGNGGVIGPPNTVTQIFKDKVTTFTSSGTFNKATANPAAPGNAPVVVVVADKANPTDSPLILVTVLR